MAANPTGGGLSPQKSEDGIGSDVECFQNFTAPEVFTQGLAGMVNQQDIHTIVRSQQYMLTRFEKTNEMLSNCNALSATRYQNAVADFKKHTQMLKEMRKDIDNIFRRVRAIKAKLSEQYPQAYEAAATTQRKEKGRDKEDSDGEDDEDLEAVAVAQENLTEIPPPPAPAPVPAKPETTQPKLESDV